MDNKSQDHQIRSGKHLTDSSELSERDNNLSSIRRALSDSANKANNTNGTNSFSSLQRQFLNLAENAGVDCNLFDEYVPEIHFREENPDPDKPTVMYLHTGGTLMMVPSKKDDQALSFDGAINIEQVINACDDLTNIRSRYNVIGVFLSSVDSKDVRSQQWTAMAAAIKTLYEKIDGVVIGHGTHTLEYSAAALSFALQNIAIPVVLTASQIPMLGFPGSDGLQNFTGALEVAANSDLAEVVAYANGKIFRGSRVIKRNDSRLDAFDAPVSGPLGYFTAGGIELRPGAIRRVNKRKSDLIFRPHFSHHVTAIKLQPGMSNQLLDMIVESEKDVGVILETYGSGAIPKDLVEPMKRHLKRGFPIFLSSSCAESGVSALMQMHDEDAIEAYEAGVRTVLDMSTTAATVKLMSIKGSYPRATLKLIEDEMIRRSYAGEIMTNDA